MSAHADTRFPQAENTHACRSCRDGDHVHCTPTVLYIGWEHPCACNEASPAEHGAARRQALVESLLETDALTPSIGGDVFYVDADNLEYLVTTVLLLAGQVGL